MSVSDNEPIVLDWTAGATVGYRLTRRYITDRAVQLNRWHSQSSTPSREKFVRPESELASGEMVETLVCLGDEWRVLRSHREEEKPKKVRHLWKRE